MYMTKLDLAKLKFVGDCMEINEWSCVHVCDHFVVKDKDGELVGEWTSQITMANQLFKQFAESYAF